ncbi:MAG TPA: hypothetical protein DG355_01590, partial [Candidatus Cloacimonas sp.]|nr:hypothetical protein [Candidatus Cloacimonas sp.]
NKIAYIEYQDALHEARVGEIVAGRRIIEINERSIRYTMGGNTYTANLMPRPVLDLDNPVSYKIRDNGNW